jgi:hypothetical protein
MKVSELFEAIVDDHISDITVTDKGDGSFLINSPKAIRGATLDVLMNVFNAFEKKAGVTMKSKAGLELDYWRMAKNRPNGFIVSFKKPEGMKEKLEAAVEDQKAKVLKKIKSDAAYKAKAPERRKEASKANAVYAKQDKEERDKKYGKGTWNRVTYRQEGGDDGYQYVLRIDGRAVLNGLTRYSAEGEKRMALAKIAKDEGLGEYAKKK